jgi:hypothetical protein
LWKSPRDIASTDYYHYADHQSEHYPGFDIYYDPTRKQSPTPVPGMCDEEEEEEMDETKENSQPPRKSKKTVSLPNTTTVSSGRVKAEPSRSKSIPVATH